MSVHPPTRPVDLNEVAELVDQLERDLARARRGDESIDTLRAEVERLRQLLAVQQPSAGDVHAGLHDVRSRLHDLSDDLRTGVLTGTDYLARIGRLLGLS